MMASSFLYYVIDWRSSPLCGNRKHVVTVRPEEGVKPEVIAERIFRERKGPSVFIVKVTRVTLERAKSLVGK